MAEDGVGKIIILQVTSFANKELFLRKYFCYKEFCWKVLQ